MSKPKILVIGAGPSGMFAAGEASKLGADVTILEKKPLPGIKLRITGKGRCNLTNIAPIPEFIDRFGKNGKFLRQAFHSFFSPDVRALFKEMGVDIQTERGGRVFPKDNDAPAIAEALVNWTKKQGVDIMVNASVDELLVEENKIIGVKTNNKDYYADRVILTTGGASYPVTGSTGDGYTFARSLGHTVIPIRPALVPLDVAGDVAKRLDKLHLKNINARVFADGKKTGERFGELFFRKGTLAGPIILSVSRNIVDQINAGIKNLSLSIDLKPALDHNKLDARLLREFQANDKVSMSVILESLLPKMLISYCLEETNISPDKLGNQVTSDERKRLRVWLKDFRLHITGYRPFKEAIITNGGVNTKEINPKTMESKLISGLYIAGELLDINGDTGGYNLQASFSTGWLAGHSAALSCF
ncbi:MAG: NAD(P)/FAD-dependent oxidoreductase [Calditrichaeota bacterium]|nr:MAG: NAD(P)/FAD-dependent oxidoreductase [Calditrichota bacterium]